MIWEKEVVAKFTVLYQALSRRYLEKIMETSTRIVLSGSRFEPGSS
jgi:hypothetical protein